MSKTAIGIAAALTSVAVATPAGAAPLSVRDSFRIGTGGTIFCSAQTLATDPVLKGMFDAGYSVTCRDAALPVGKIFKLTATGDAAARMAAARAGKATCSSPSSTNIRDLGRVETIECKLKDADVGYRVYQYRKGKLLRFSRMST